MSNTWAYKIIFPACQNTSMVKIKHTATHQGLLPLLFLDDSKVTELHSQQQSCGNGGVSL